MNNLILGDRAAAACLIYLVNTVTLATWMTALLFDKKHKCVKAFSCF